MWNDMFPDAPAWLPWLAVTLNSMLAVFLILAIFPSPIEAWTGRKDRRDAGKEFEADLIRFQKIEADLLNAPAKKGVTAELRRVGADG